MVDAIKNTVNRMELTKGRIADGRPSGLASPASLAPTVRPLKLAMLRPQRRQPTCRNAPVNTGAVRRIKDAISRGEYPINVDRISEALMDAYRDMKA